MPEEKNKKQNRIMAISIFALLIIAISGMVFFNSGKKDSETTKTEIKAMLNDTVTIDFTGYLNNEEFSGGSAEGYSVLLGSNTFVDDFEQQIVGHKAGDEFNVNVTFPENFRSEELAGKDVVFKVKVHEIWRKIATDNSDEKLN